MRRPIGLGLIGLGHWGRAIATTLGDLPEARLVAVARRGPMPADQAPAGSVVHQRWRALVESPEVAGVVIATPPETHSTMVMAALRAGKAVFVEKPMCLSMRDATSLVEEARAQAAIVHVDHIDLRNPAWRALVEQLPRLGSIRSVEAQFGTDGLCAAPLWEWGPHPVALCCSLFDEPRVAAAWADGPRVAMTLALAGGTHAEVVVGGGFPGRRRRMTIACDAGLLSYDDNAPERLVLEVAGSRRALEHEAERPLAVALRRFVAACADGRPDHQDVLLGARVVGVLEAAEAALQKAG